MGDKGLCVTLTRTFEGIGLLRQSALHKGADGFWDREVVESVEGDVDGDQSFDGSAADPVTDQGLHALVF